MVQAPQLLSDLASPGLNGSVELNFQLPDPEDENISELEFQQQVDTAWQVCDRFDLQTDIWRGRILRTVREREKCSGDRRGSGFLHWLQEREISKSQAYSWIELANSADILLEKEYLEPATIERFSKRAFMETAQAAPEVQQLITDAARKGDRITRREVKQLADEWTAMTSDLLPAAVKEKASAQTIPTRYLAPLVRELEKLPASHQASLGKEIAEASDIDTLKQATTTARYLGKYLTAATQVQALHQESLNLELALEEALRLDCLNATAELVNQAAQLEQTTVKLYTTWKRLNRLVERLYLDSGASTPNLRALLNNLTCLTGETVEVQLGALKGNGVTPIIRLKMLSSLADDSQLSANPAGTS